MQDKVETTRIASDNHATDNCLTCTDVHAQAGIEACEEARWYVLRDLRRPNSKVRGYEALEQRGVEVYTPMKWVIENRVVGNRTKKERRLRPVIWDLLFVHGQETDLKPVVADAGSLIFRFVRGAYMKAMTVGDTEMENFIRATKLSDAPQYYELEELTPAMLGRAIRITDGPLAGCTGKLLKIKGARKKRAIISIPELLAVGVEVTEGMFEFV